MNLRFEDENGKLVDYDPSLTEIKDKSTTEVGTGNAAYTKGEAGSLELPKELFTTSGIYNIIVYATDNN